MAREVMSSYHFLANNMMPEGVFTFGYNQGMAGTINNRYNASGNRVANKEWNSRSLKFNDIVESAQDQTDRILSQAAFRSFGINLSSEAGFVENDINVNTESRVFVLGYGLSKTSNFFMIVPTINVRFDVQSNFRSSLAYDKLISDLRNSGQAQKADYLEQIKRNPLKTRLNENGQNLPTEINSISNIYLNYRKKIGGLISDTFAIIPYGYQYRTTDFIDFRLNDNSLGIKQGFGYDQVLTNRATLGLYGSYHYRSPFRMDYRVPRTANDPLTSDIEEDLYVKYGDQMDFSTQLQYQWNEVVSPYINFRYLYSFQDEFQGTSFQASRYEILERETESKSFSGQVGLVINTIKPFLAKKFLLPMDLNIQYSKTLFAQNSFDVDWISFNLMVFYR
jgi:hypothetical protein